MKETCTYAWLSIQVRKQGEEGGKPKPKVIDFEPENPGEVNEPPKFGKEDNKQHSGGNTWAGGTVSQPVVCCP